MRRKKFFEVVASITQKVNRIMKFHLNCVFITSRFRGHSANNFLPSISLSFKLNVTKLGIHIGKKWPQDETILDFTRKDDSFKELLANDLSKPNSI